MGWRRSELGDVPAIFHYGDNFDYHGLVLLQPETHRGMILLINANNALAGSSAFKEIEAGVARLLAGQEPAPTTSLNLPMFYLLVDLSLGLLLALALWPLVRMQRWMQVQQQRQREGYLRPVLISLRLLWEFGIPLTLRVVARLALHRMGAQSWGEGMSFFLDLGLWLWMFSLLMLLTGVIRLVFFIRLLQHKHREQAATSSAASALQHPA